MIAICGSLLKVSAGISDGSCRSSPFLRLISRTASATLVATLNDGRMLESHVDFPKGDPENPATMDEIKTKFHSLTEKYIDQEKREKIIDMVDRLEEVENLAQLADMVR